MFMARDPENKFPLESSSLMDKGKVQREGLRGPRYHLPPSITLFLPQGAKGSLSEAETFRRSQRVLTRKGVDLVPPVWCI